MLGCNRPELSSQTGSPPVEWEVTNSGCLYSIPGSVLVEEPSFRYSQSNELQFIYTCPRDTPVRMSLRIIREDSTHWEEAEYPDVSRMYLIDDRDMSWQGGVQ